MLGLVIAIVVAGGVLAVAAIVLGYLTGDAAHPYDAYRSGVARLVAAAHRAGQRRGRR